MSASQLKALAAASNARVAKDEKLIQISKDIEEGEKEKGKPIKLADIRKKDKESKPRAKELKTRAERRKQEQNIDENPYLLESLRVATDLISALK